MKRTLSRNLRYHRDSRLLFRNSVLKMLAMFAGLLIACVPVGGCTSNRNQQSMNSREPGQLWVFAVFAGQDARSAGLASRIDNIGDVTEPFLLKHGQFVCDQSEWRSWASGYGMIDEPADIVLTSMTGRVFSKVEVCRTHRWKLGPGQAVSTAKGKFSTTTYYVERISSLKYSRACLIYGNVEPESSTADMKFARGIFVRDYDDVELYTKAVFSGQLYFVYGDKNYKPMPPFGTFAEDEVPDKYKADGGESGLSLPVRVPHTSSQQPTPPSGSGDGDLPPSERK